MAILNAIPDFVFEEKVDFETLVTKFENGVEQRRAKRNTPIRKWTLQFHNRTTAEINSIKSFFLHVKAVMNLLLGRTLTTVLSIQ